MYLINIYTYKYRCVILRRTVKTYTHMANGNGRGNTNKPATDEVKTTASAETLKGRRLTWLSAGFSGEDGEVFTVIGVDAPEWKNETTGKQGTYAALLVRGASFTTVPIGRFVRPVLSSKGVLTPQGTLADAIRAAAAKDGDQFDAAVAIATALAGVKLTLRVVPYEGTKGGLGRVFEAYKNGAEAAPEDARLKKL